MTFIQAPDINNMRMVARFSYLLSHNGNKWKFGPGLSHFNIQVLTPTGWYTVKKGDWIILNNDGTFYQGLKYLLQ